jgi:hypothetical protein
MLVRVRTRRRKTPDARDAASQVSHRHNYQIKAPVTVDKVIGMLKLEAQDALAGAYYVYACASAASIA